jgi:hypothetical protein
VNNRSDRITQHSAGRGNGIARLADRRRASVICSNIRDRYFIDLVSVLVHDDNEPISPVPARHDRALFEVACQRDRVGASGGIARQINAFVLSRTCLPSVR